MNYLLDTNVLSRFLNRRPSRVKTRLANQEPDSLATCTIVEAELRYGALKSSDSNRLAGLIDRLLAELTVLDFDSQCAHRYAWIRSKLEASGMVIGSNDMQIAAVALAHNLTLVTHNVAEFARVPGLVVEGWEIDDVTSG